METLISISINKEPFEGLASRLSDAVSSVKNSAYALASKLSDETDLSYAKISYYSSVAANILNSTSNYSSYLGKGFLITQFTAHYNHVNQSAEEWVSESDKKMANLSRLNFLLNVFAYLSDSPGLLLTGTIVTSISNFVNVSLKT